MRQAQHDYMSFTDEETGDWNNKAICPSSQTLAPKLLPCNFLSDGGAKSIFCSSIWFSILVPDTELLNPLEFPG